MEQQWFSQGLFRLLIATLLVAYTSLSWLAGLARLLYYVCKASAHRFRRFVKWLYAGAEQSPKHHPRPSEIPTPVYDALTFGTMLVAGFVYLVT